MKLFVAFLLSIVLFACQFSSGRLTGGDIRLWQDTPAWDLAKAVKANDTNQINHILTKENLSIDYREPLYGESLLHWAVWNNRIEMVRFLLSKEANPNLHNQFNGRSPIIISCEDDSDAEILRLLLKYGGDPNDHVIDKDTVTYERSIQTPLTNAASTSLEKTKILLEAGANVDFSIIPGETPLHIAALGNHFDIVKYLLEEAGADYHKVFSVTLKGDTLRFTDILAMFPYQDTESNRSNLKQIYEFLEKSKEQ